MKKFRYITIPLALLIGFVMFFDYYINFKCEDMIKKKDINKMKHEYENIVRDRGGIFKDNACKNNDLLLLGSSELNSSVDQNPIRMFPFRGAEYDVSVFGRAYTQSLQHSAVLSSTKNLTSNKKVAFVLSLSWFVEYKVLGDSDYESNFSEYQFYKMMSNKKISNDNKNYYATRTYEMLKESKNYPDEAIYSKLYLRNDFMGKILFTVAKPYYKVKEHLLEIKDKIQTYNAIRNLEDKKTNKGVKEIDWEEESKKAESQGKEKTCGNFLRIDNDLYNENIKDNYDKVENILQNVNLLECREMEDYKFFLNVCKDLKIEPLIILMPVHGQYYDHMGLTREKRNAYYDKAEQLAKEKGFGVLNLKDKDYEDYYMIDTMHLGWKGWLDIDKKMVDYYKNIEK